MSVCSDDKQFMGCFVKSMLQELGLPPVEDVLEGRMMIMHMLQDGKVTEDEFNQLFMKVCQQMGDNFNSNE